MSTTTFPQKIFVRAQNENNTAFRIAYPSCEPMYENLSIKDAAAFVRTIAKRNAKVNRKPTKVIYQKHNGHFIKGGQFTVKP